MINIKKVSYLDKWVSLFGHRQRPGLRHQTAHLVPLYFVVLQVELRQLRILQLANDGNVLYLVVI